MRGGDQKIMWFRCIFSVVAAGVRVAVPESTRIHGRVRVVAGGGGTGRVVLSSCWAWSACMGGAGSCRHGCVRDYRSSRAACTPASNRTTWRGSCWCPGSHVGC